MERRNPGTISGDGLIPQVGEGPLGLAPSSHLMGLRGSNEGSTSVTQVLESKTVEFTPPSAEVELVPLQSARPLANAAPSTTAQTTTAERPPTAPTESPAPEPAQEVKGPRLIRKKKRQRRRWDAPAWAVSAVVHVGIFGILAALTVASETEVKQITDLDTALVSASTASEEMLVPAADPGERRSEVAAGDTSNAEMNISATEGLRTSIGSGPPSQTPVVGGRGSGAARVGEGTSLPAGAVRVRALSPISSLPSLPTVDLDSGGGGGGGHGVVGDPMFGADNHGMALDQIAREILKHLLQHRVTVVWMFDESESMRDDQRAIREKFNRVTRELEKNVKIDDRKNPPLTHAIVGFGAQTHFELEKPTADVDLIGKTIDRLRVDPTGIEKTNGAIQEVINHYAPLIRKDRRLLIVLVTDESGDDGEYVEETLQLARAKGVPIYVIGRQSPFGYPYIRHRYIDPVTGDTYWPTIRRGPETADVECLQWDGLHDRWEEQASGFAPYELARLAKETAGIFFLLPTEEEMRQNRAEKLYSIKTLKEYVPMYESRVAYNDQRVRSELRRTLSEIINDTRGFGYRRHYPIDQAGFNQAALEEAPKVTDRLNILITIEKRLKSLQKARDRETERRWQAHYDLMLAQVVAYQIQAYEYRATLKAMMQKLPKPSKPPTADIEVNWILDHAKEPRAPKGETEKQYAEATRLLKQVIERHPNTPWADLAKVELDRGFSVGWYEWRSNPRYEERAKLVPKY